MKYFILAQGQPEREEASQFTYGSRSKIFGALNNKLVAGSTGKMKTIIVAPGLREDFERHSSFSSFPFSVRSFSINSSIIL